MPLYFYGGITHWIPVTQEVDDILDQLTANRDDGIIYSVGKGPFIEAALRVFADQHRGEATQFQAAPDFRPTERLKISLLSDYRDQVARDVGGALDSTVRAYSRRLAPMPKTDLPEDQYLLKLPRRMLLHQAQYAIRDGHDIIEDLTAVLNEASRRLTRDLLYLDGKMVNIDVPISRPLFHSVRKIAWEKSSFDIDTMYALTMDDILRTRSNPISRWQTESQYQP